MSSPIIKSAAPIQIPQAELDRLYYKVNETRHPTSDVVADTGDDYGVPTAWMTELLRYWRTDYSWQAAQDKLNQVPAFTAEIEGLTLYFQHRTSPDPNAIPLLLLHGWPGSFYEFSLITPLLSEPEKKDTQSFHLITPSLPGFPFSSPPPRKSWTVKDTARVLNTLMLQLGYERYAVQAGDWGQFVARELGAQCSQHCTLIHLNYCPGTLPSELNEEELTEREKACRDKGTDWRTQHVGYAVLMRTRPQTLGYILADNPIGLLAFIGEKYIEASNPAVHYTAQWKEHVLTTVCLYYFSNCITSSALIYYENVPHHDFAEYAVQEENVIKCPFGYTSCWFDTAPNCRRAVERTGNLVFYRERDYAGHFACLEDPKGVAEDLRELVSGWWKP